MRPGDEDEIAARGDDSAQTQLFPRRARPPGRAPDPGSGRAGTEPPGPPAPAGRDAAAGEPTEQLPWPGTPGGPQGPRGEPPAGPDGPETLMAPLPGGRPVRGGQPVPDGPRDGSTVQLPLPGAAASGDRPEPSPVMAGPSAEPPPYRPYRAPAGPGPSGAARRRALDRLRTAMVWTRRIIVCTVITVLLSPLLVAFRVWYVAREDSTPRSDAVIVLGAAQYDGTPSPVFQWRLKHAARLYREKVAPVVVTVGGGQPGDRFTEAASGRRWLIQHGVPAARVVAVGTGADTQESLVAVGKEFRRHDWDSAVLVSDPWHALRTRTMARDQGIKAETSPTRSGPIVQTRGTQARYIVRETGAYLQYVLDGRE